MILEQHEKYSEMTYGVHAAILADIAPDNALTLMQPDELVAALKALDHGVMGARRSLITRFQLLKQAIGYGLTYRVVFGDAPKLQFAVYKRNKLNSAKELQSVLSLCAGGHVEGEDLSYHIIKPKAEGEPHQTSGAVDMLETIDDSFAAEYIQEVRLADANNNDLTEGVVGAQMAKGFEKLGFVMDSKPNDPTYVGNIHFGVLYALEAPAEAVSFEMREKQNEGVAWADAEELVTNAGALEGLSFEPWSQMIVDQIILIEGLILERWHGVKFTPDEVYARVQGFAKLQLEVLAKKGIVIDVDPADPDPVRTIQLTRQAFEEAQVVDIRQQLESIAKEAWAKVTADSSLSVTTAASKVEELTADLINEKLSNFLTSYRVEVLPLQGQDEQGHFFEVNFTATDTAGKNYSVPTKQHLVTVEASEA